MSRYTTANASCSMNGVRCSDCGFGNPEAARFCAGCGARLAQSCPAWARRAGRPSVLRCVRAQARGRAGASLDARRRRAAASHRPVLRPGRLHPPQPATGRRGSACPPRTFFASVDGIVQSFGGTVDKHIGDCVMAVFGAPVATATTRSGPRAPLAIRDACRTLQAQVGPARWPLHLGLASGQVVASGTGGEPHRLHRDRRFGGPRLPPPIRRTVDKSISDAVRIGAYLALRPVRRRGRGQGADWPVVLMDPWWLT